MRYSLILGYFWNGIYLALHVLSKKKGGIRYEKIAKEFREVDYGSHLCRGRGI